MENVNIMEIITFEKQYEIQKPDSLSIIPKEQIKFRPIIDQTGTPIVLLKLYPNILNPYVKMNPI